MKQVSLSLLFCAAISMVAPIAVSQKRLTDAGPSTDGLACSTFSWFSDKNSSTAGIHVPITIAGKQYSYQLDTGADVMIAYGAGEHKNWVEKKEFSVAGPVQFAGMTVTSVPMFRMKDTSDVDVQGTMGLDFLVGHTFLIDFPKNRVCLLNRGDLPDSLNQAATWVPAEIRNGKLFLNNVSLNGKPINLIYDSGSSPDEVDVDFPLWKEATGKQTAAEATTHHFAQTWGEQVDYVVAKATGTLQLGKREYSNPKLTASPSRPNSFQKNIFGASGVLGNALFLQSIVILDLGSHPYFGVIPISR
jgi:hypothetical protein